MPTPLIIKIDVLKLNKDWFFTGAKGKYADLIAYENDTVSQYGDSHTIKQSPSQEARAKGEKAIIVGNGKWMPQRGGNARPDSGARPLPKTPIPASEQEEDSIPF